MGKECSYRKYGSGSGSFVRKRSMAFDVEKEGKVFVCRHQNSKPGKLEAALFINAFGKDKK